MEIKWRKQFGRNRNFQPCFRYHFQIAWRYTQQNYIDSTWNLKTNCSCRFHSFFYWIKNFVTIRKTLRNPWLKELTRFTRIRSRYCWTQSNNIWQLIRTNPCQLYSLTSWLFNERKFIGAISEEFQARFKWHNHIRNSEESERNWRNLFELERRLRRVRSYVWLILRIW